jgi:hypothetical protein
LEPSSLSASPFSSRQTTRTRLRTPSAPSSTRPDGIRTASLSSLVCFRECKADLTHGNRPLTWHCDLSSVQWTMTDYDASAHICEEVRRASIAAPVAIFIAVM